ncbi:MAG: Asp-tRNA(Asn)/Glu-tRNA(Gln) amidotransferase subunit GatB [Xanthobacteraceae bacterium]
MDAPAHKKSKLINGWEVVIGLEVHAQVTSQAKLFSGASTAFGGGPNSHVSLVDAAMPGMLPVINEECVRQAVRTGLGLKAKINLKSVFDRKNYFYPDLPQGYQISQYKSPIVGEGEVVVDLHDGEIVRIGIERLHLEQDAGKSLHDQHASMSLVDLNRSGVALMEIVTKPDLRSADEAKAFLAKLRSMLRYLGTCDGDMEKGHLRADVNVSVRKPGAALGTRCEIKNLNSFNFIGQAIEHEAWRQINIIEEGGKIEQETRLFDPAKGETRSMRNKEEAHDYRYFPDPDLLPLELSPKFIEDLERTLPELRAERKLRFIGEYGLSSDEAEVLTAEKVRADYYEAMVKDGADPKESANWLINEYLGRLGSEAISESHATVEQTEPQFVSGPTGPVAPDGLEPIPRSIGPAATDEPQVIPGPTGPAPPTGRRAAVRPIGPTAPAERQAAVGPTGPTGPAGPDVNPPQIRLGPTGPAANAQIVQMISRGEISRRMAKDLLTIVIQVSAPNDPNVIIQIAVDRGMKQVTDLSALEKLVDDIIAKNPDKIADAKTNPKAIGWFVGQVMKASGGKANPQAVNDLLKKRIGS